MTIFFVLSGFLLVVRNWDVTEIYSYDLKKSTRFSISKIKKLYPLHILMMIAALFLSILGVVLDAGDGKIIPIQVMVSTLLLQTWIPIREYFSCMNFVSWYISAMLFIYICFPYILRRIKKIKCKRVAICNIIILFVFQLAWAFMMCRGVNLQFINDDVAYWAIYLLPPARCIDFIIGCNLAYLYLKRDTLREIEPFLHYWNSLELLFLPSRDIFTM